MLQDIWNQELIQLGEGRVLTVGQLVVALLLLLAGLVLSRLIAKMAGRRLEKSSVWGAGAQVTEQLIFYVLVITVGLTTLRFLTIPITAFAFLGGAVAIGVGFGAQNIINNFVSGWILLTEKPIRLGDVIEVEGKHGRVEAIGSRCTRVRRTDGIDALVPNSKVIEGTVVNWTLTDDNVRAQVRVGVAYGSDVDRVMVILDEVARRSDEVLTKPGPLVIFEDFGDNALVFDLYFWTHAAAPMQLRRVASHLRVDINRALTEAGIVIAFPQRDVHLDATRPIPVHMVDQGAA